MFKESRRRIVAAIMSILVLLWAGTLCTIYVSSYIEVSSRNRNMLKEHTEFYSLRPQIPDDRMPIDGPGPEGREPYFKDKPIFKLSTFYTVAISKNGEVLAVDNYENAVYDDEKLEEAAREVIGGGKESGIMGSLIYRMADKGDYILVAFMDNTIVRESMSTLFRYTLIFGSMAMAVLFFLAVYLAKRIIQPLEESYTKQKQFISDAGHELKTPVSVVSANAELLQREIGENQWLSNILYENKRMGTLIGQLLELARTENAAPQMEKIDFGRLIGGESLPFESVVYEKGLHMECEILSNLFVFGSSVQLKQLTAILIDNAIRYCKPDGKILITLKSCRNAAVFSVANDGDEIPLKQQKQIFERFYRIDYARGTKEEHYGLGLAIAKAIVTAHRGKIEVACHDGMVEFSVSIPKFQ